MPLIQLCFNLRGVFLNEFDIGRVVSILKEGSSEDVNNYHTATVTSLVFNFAEGFEEGKNIKMTMCDLGKAFDVNHHNLLIKFRKLHFFI